MGKLERSKHYLFRRKFIYIAGVAVLVVVIAGGVLAYSQHQKATNLTNVEVVKSKVARHFVLPTNEQPALATITDTDKLTSAFFKKAKNGDRVLIYQKNSIAIIYRPSIDRIIAVGPVQIDTPPSATAPAAP